MAEENKSTQDAQYEERIDNSYDQFVDSVGDTTATLKDMKNKLKEQKQKTDEANAVIEIRTPPVRHNDVCEVAEMEATVKAWLGI